MQYRVYHTLLYRYHNPLFMHLLLVVLQKCKRLTAPKVHLYVMVEFNI